MNCKIVAELGINHNGSLALAFDMIEAAQKAGCEYVKFQKRTIEKVYSKEELDKPRSSPWGKTNRDLKTHLEFGKREFDQINNFCDSIGMKWFASPWDVDSVKFLLQYNPEYIKIPSALITKKDLLEEVKKSRVRSIISTGMSTLEEVKDCLDILGSQCEYILACTSTYPTRTDEMNMLKINKLKMDFPSYKIGFSNHHPGILFSVVAAALGAEMVEFHFTLDRSVYGSDQAASIELPGMVKIVDYIKEIEKGWGDGEWKVFPSELPIKKKLRKE
jgi:N-acetylneuraminate synthase